MDIRHIPVAALLFAGALAVPHSVRAAESYDNCTGYIDTLPTTIATSGTWCLRKDLATNVTSGAAISIANDDVTIDCNDFKLGGLAAGNGSTTAGVFANAHQDVTIRHCNIRGFKTGIFLSGGSGHLVEDNRLDNNLFVGIDLDSTSGSRVRRNAVYDTGGFTENPHATGIYATADIDDNIVDGVFTATTTASVTGIESRGDDSRVSGNRIGGLVLNGGGSAFGIMAFGSHQAVVGTRATAAAAATNGSGLYGTAYCSANTVANFTTPINFCTDDGGNAAL
jgi:parallel beta-helix repeat protein